MAIKTETAEHTFTKQQLFNIHQQKLQYDKNYNNCDNTGRLTDIFGGIDFLLTILLSSDNITLDTEKLQQIHDIISENSNHRNCSSGSIIKTVNDNESAEEWTYCFSKTNTFLHSLFGLEKGQKIFDFIYLRRTWIVTFLWMFICAITATFASLSSVIVCCFLFGSLSYFFVWGILIILSSNRKCFKLTISSFTFWFKLFYAIQLFVVGIIVSNKWYSCEIDVAVVAVWDLCFVLLVALTALFDALQIRLSFKILFSVLFAMYWTFWVIKNNIHLYLKGDAAMITIESIGWSISPLSIYINAQQILAIFMWKHAVSSIMNKKRCILVKYSPYLRWCECDNVNISNIKDEYQLMQADDDNL